MPSSAKHINNHPPSSKPSRPSSSSGTQPQQHQQQQSLAGFESETAEVLPPSLTEEEEGGKGVTKGEEEHPLLALHQSVGGGRGGGSNGGNVANYVVKRGNGSRSREPKEEGKEEITTARQLPQSQDSLEKKSSSGTTQTRTSMNDPNHKERANNGPATKLGSHDMMQEGGEPWEKNQYKRASKRPSLATRLATVLFKTVAVVALLFLWLSLMNSAAINSSLDTNSSKTLSDLSSRITAAQTSLPSLAQEFSRHVSTLLPALSTAGKDGNSETERIDGWIASGRDLLKRYDDASGSAASCGRALRVLTTVGNDGGGGEGDAGSGDPASSLLVSSLAASLTAEKNALLSRALLCVGEASLASFSSMFVSRETRAAHLAEARDSFEAATAVDPANPSVRAGLGLSYLLLGTIKSEAQDADESKQIMFRSIQHLNAAVGLTKSAAKVDEDTMAIRTVAMHNLGLAYMALDGMGSAGETTSHFLDWATSLRSSGTAQSVLESWVFAANEGASLLHAGRVEEAVSSLESTASEVCANDLSSSSGRQREACLIVHQNLAVAREALYGNGEDLSSVQWRSGGTAMHDKIARWNAEASLESSPVEVSEAEPGEDVNATSSLNDSDTAGAGTGEENNETPPSPEEVSNAISSDSMDEKNDAISTHGKTEEPSNIADDEESISSLSTKKLKPEVQSALAALERATAEGTQKTRLLIALAKARASAGDSSGAVDAAVRAIGAAASEVETEAATSYLEMLMEKMVGEEEKEDVMPVLLEEYAVEKSEKAPSFVENRDFALTELQLKLEIERLKYKVLEQDMRLGQRYQSPPQYRDDGMRAIDYRQRADTIVHDTPVRQQHDPIEESFVTSETVNEPLKLEPEIDYTQEEPAQPEVDHTQEEPAPVVNLEESVSAAPKNETGDANIEDLEGSKTSSELDNVDEELFTEAVTENDDIQPGENLTSTAESESDINATDPVEEVPAVEPIQLPSLHEPDLKPPGAIPPTARSYMKMADAYLDKGQYALASKQFLKVIKKAPDHLPAHLGYATALERAGKSKQITTAALAYGNATKVAIVQGERVDPMAKAGTGGIAENILKRALLIAKSAPSGRLETLRVLSECAHTASLAADAYFEVGMEIVKLGIDQEGNQADALQAFTIANEFVAMRNDTEIPYHIESMVGLAKIAFEQNDVGKVIELFNKIKNVHMEDDLHVELLVLVGRAHVSRGELETAITEFTRALSFPKSLSTQSAHHELAIALEKNNGDTHEINLHFEKALDMGMDPTAEAMEALGERNRSMMRALNRQYYKSYNSGGADKSGGGGGIMSGGGVGSQSTSVFAPQAKQNEVTSTQADALSILEQGAASYDGKSPMGGEVEGAASSLDTLKAKKQTGSESHLSEIRR